MNRTRQPGSVGLHSGATINVPSRRDGCFALFFGAWATFLAWLFLWNGGNHFGDYLPSSYVVESPIIAVVAAMVAVQLAPYEAGSVIGEPERCFASYFPC